MASDKDPNINIGGNARENIVIQGDNNKIIQQAAPKPFNDTGAFLPVARNKLFTGREAALKELAEALTGNPNVVITQAITGMGGIGKSQLALEFAYRSLENKDFVSAHWLNLADPSQLGAEIATCGRRMGLLNDEAKQPDTVAETLRVWASRGPRLLVLDNYESAADALQTLALLLQAPTLRLLITARRADFPPELGLRPYALEVFTPEDSLEFLRKLVKLSDEQTPGLEKLAEALGHLPLALHLAGHYLREEGITPAEYLRELDQALTHESMQAAWFKEMDIASPTAHEQSLLGTFTLSWQKVTDERAQTIFKLAGYLAPNTPIPVEIFAAVLELDEKDRALKRALRLLEKVGLFTNKDGLLVIHPLLAAYARYLNGELSALLEKLAHRLAVLAKDATDRVDETGSLTWFTPLQAHVLVAAEYTEKAGLAAAANLYGNLGHYLQIIAYYLGAQLANERAIRIWEANLGKNHPQVAIYVNDLGSALLELGDLDRARAAFERAIQIWEANLGENHPYLATSVNNLGTVLKSLGDLEGARAAFERALKIGEVAFGKDHSSVAIRVNNLGVVLRELGDLGGARAAFERALKIDEISFGKNHPYVARDVNNLGMVFQSLGDLDSAHAAFERSLKIDEIAFGKDHPHIAISIGNLGTVLQTQGEKDQARACYQRALAIFEQFLPAGHPNIETAKGWLKSLEDLP